MLFLEVQVLKVSLQKPFYKAAQRLMSAAVKIAPITVNLKENEAGQ